MQTANAKTTVPPILLGLSILIMGVHSAPVAAKQEAKPSAEQLRAGKNFIPTEVYCAEADEQILKLFDSLRVADVSDGDGVIVVPRAQAEEVAEYAQGVVEGDKAGRRRLYKKLGLPPDDSVK